MFHLYLHVQQPVVRYIVLLVRIVQSLGRLECDRELETQVKRSGELTGTAFSPTVTVSGHRLRLASNGIPRRLGVSIGD